MTEILTVSPSRQFDTNNDFCLKKCPFRDSCVTLEAINNLSRLYKPSTDSIDARIEALVLTPQVASLVFELVEVQTACVDSVSSGEMPSKHTTDTRVAVRNSIVGEFAQI